MNTSFKNSLFITLVFTLLVFTGCKKDFDSPPITVLPEGNIITVDSLRKIYTSFDSTIVNDFSVFGTVTADELSGNLYKTIYIQDGTAGILLKLTASSDKTFFQGDKVRVSLKGTIISRYKNMIQLTNVNPDVHLIKQGKGDEIAPKVVTIAEAKSLTGIYSKYQGQLVQINDVEFICSDICKSYADAVSQKDASRMLMDTLGTQIIVRSSGFASFAGIRVAQGRGSIIAIVSQYNSDIQLTIRKLEEVNLTGTRKIICAPCPNIITSKDFEDYSITSGGWSSKIAIGNYHWTIGTIGGTYAQITNYAGSNTASEAWLISPNFNLSSTNTPTLKFRNAYKYTGDPLKLMVTTNYDPANPTNPANWSEIVLTPTNWSTGNFSWVSANVDLSTYKQPNVRFAFKYTGTNSSGSTWEVDDITITDL